MSKITFNKPGNFIYPIPAVMVSCHDGNGRNNIITIAWTGTICSDPPMAYISVRSSRFSYHMLKETREFVINLPNERLARATDYCGCTSGEKVDKFAQCHLTPGEGTVVSCPTIAQAPVSIECRVKDILPLGSHDMFLAEVVAVQVDDAYLDEKNTFHMDRVGLLAYEHGSYRAMGEKLGSFGFAVRRKNGKKKKGRTTSR